MNLFYFKIKKQSELKSRSEKNPLQEVLSGDLMQRRQIYTEQTGIYTLYTASVVLVQSQFLGL